MSSIKQEQSSLEDMLSALEGKSTASSPKTTGEPLDSEIESLPIQAIEQLLSTFYTLIADIPAITAAIIRMKDPQVPKSAVEVSQQGQENDSLFEALNDPNKYKNLFLALFYMYSILSARVSLLEGNPAPALALVLACKNQEEK